MRAGPLPGVEAATVDAASAVAARHPGPLAHQRQHGVDRRRRHLDQPAHAPAPAVTSASISIGRPRSRSCSIEVLCAPTAAAAVDAAGRRRSGSARRASRRSPAPRPSWRGRRARVPGSAQISSSVAPVSALIGLKERLPQSLTQISSRMSGRTGALRPAAISASDRRLDARSCCSPVGLAEREAVALDVARPRRARRPRPPDRRRSRSRAPAPMPSHCMPPGSTARQPAARVRPAEAVEVPPGHAVHCAVTTAVSGPEQRLRSARRRRRHRMRLQRDDDVVLRRRARPGSSVARDRDGARCPRAASTQRRRPVRRGSPPDAARARRQRTTSAPALAQLGAPGRPPMAPAPKMQIRITPQAQLLREADALQLAGGALRDLGEEHDLARHLEVGEAAGGEVAQLALGSPPALAQHDRGGDLLAELVVRHGEGDAPGRPPDGPSAPRRPRAGEIFSPPRLMISLSRPVMREIAVGVEHALVAGAEPAVGEGLGVGLGIVLVAGRDVGPADHDLAGRARRQQRARPSSMMRDLAARPRRRRVPGLRGAGGSGFVVIWCAASVMP